MFGLFRKKRGILLVCSANICRSPMAEGLMKAALKAAGRGREFKVYSAGTHASQLGHQPDGRSVKVMAEIGVDIRRIRARQVQIEDFERFEYVLCMEQKNLDWLLEKCPNELSRRITLLGDWAEPPTAIPDPYYGSAAGFRQTLDQMQSSIEQFLLKISR